jgi:hypothetical protein
VGINYWVPSPSELWSETKDSLGMDESMFDRRHWVTSDEVFSKAHPLLSAKDRLKLSFLIGRISGATGQAIDVDTRVAVGQSTP